MKKGLSLFIGILLVILAAGYGISAKSGTGGWLSGRLIKRG
jgi:hypothetical protein